MLFIVVSSKKIMNDTGKNLWQIFENKVSINTDDLNLYSFVQKNFSKESRLKSSLVLI